MAEAVKSEDYQFSVLIVDDDLTILSLLKELVGMVPGCDVITASKLEDAMKQIVQRNVDIVFTDIHMPGVTGIEMIQDILSLEHSPETIVMTAYPSSEIAVKAMELGASSLVAKPFEDISIIELELDKAIKKILRQRASAHEVELKKAEIAKKALFDLDKDPVMKVSIPTPEEMKAASQSASSNPASNEEYPASSQEKKIYKWELIEPMVDIEMARCQRYKRQFTLGFVDIPENLQLKTRQERESFKQNQIEKLKSCFRNSDVLVDAEEDGFAILGFECNKPGSHVMEFKLIQAGFANVGFSVYPGDGSDFKSLFDAAKSAVQEKRKHKIVILEPEEFFGRIIQNMLTDPKYHVTWLRSADEAYKYVQDQSESIKIFIISLSKDAEQWKLLARLKKENLTRWPILLFTDVALDEGLKKQLQQLGIKALIKKGASQEEFVYVVQSFIMLPSVNVIRKNPRALLTLPVIYRADGNEVSSNTFTLSRDGVFIREMNPLPPETKLELELLIPGRKGPIKSKAEVLYAVPYFVGVSRIHVAGMAVRFVDLPDAQKSELDQLVSNALTGYLIDTV